MHFTKLTPPPLSFSLLPFPFLFFLRFFPSFFHFCPYAVSRNVSLNFFPFHGEKKRPPFLSGRSRDVSPSRQWNYLSFFLLLYIKRIFNCVHKAASIQHASPVCFESVRTGTENFICCQSIYRKSVWHLENFAEANRNLRYTTRCVTC